VFMDLKQIVIFSLYKITSFIEELLHVSLYKDHHQINMTIKNFKIG